MLVDAVQRKGTQQAQGAARPGQGFQQAVAGGGIAARGTDKLYIKIILKRYMGQGAAFDALHVKAAGTDLVQHHGQLAGLVAGGKQQGKPLPLAGHHRRLGGPLDHNEPRGVVAVQY